jgi:hypothetical protein
MDKIIINEAPKLLLFYDKVARFTGKNVTGLEELEKVRKVIIAI